MRLGIRSKLVCISLLLIAISLGVGYGYLQPTLDRVLSERIAADLRVRAELVARSAAVAANRPEAVAWPNLAQDLAQDLARAAQARITLLDGDGLPLGDSEVQPSEVSQLRSHHDRPEVQAARSQGHGVSVRYSATLRQRMLYVAVPFRLGSGTPAGAGIVRLAMPLVEVDRAMRTWHVAAWIGTAVALAVAVLMSSLAAHLLVGRLRQITAAAHRLARGELGALRAPPPPDPLGHEREDEVAALGRDLEQIAQSLARALEQIVAQRDLIGAVLSGMREGLLLVGGAAEQRRVLLTNPALREMLRLEGDPVGRPAHALGNEALLEALTAAAASEPSDAPMQREVETATLLPRRLLIQASRLRADASRGAGEDAALLAVVVDVTELRRLETLRRDFVANASHELRTPVSAVRSAAETLHEALRSDPEAVPRFVDMIERNAERLQRIIDDLLDLSRIEAQTYRLSPEPLASSEVAMVAARVVGLFAERALAKGITLSVRIPTELPRVQADRRALEHVLCNLIDNAIKYGPSGGAVVIGAEPRPEGGVRLFVRDSGPGIAAQHLPRLFERFYRVDAGRSRALGGTGLGLAIVRHLVEAMGGQVSVDSEPGRGSTFRFSLPPSGGTAAPAAASSGPVPALGSSG